MSDSIIDQAARVIYGHHVMAINGGTASSSRAECSCGHTSVLLGGARELVAKRHDQHVTEELARAGLLRPEIDEAMCRRAAEQMAKAAAPAGLRHLADPDIWMYEARLILEAALGGEAWCGHTDVICSKHGDPWPCVTPEASCVPECCDCHATLEEGEQ